MTKRKTTKPQITKPKVVKEVTPTFDFETLGIGKYSDKNDEFDGVYFKGSDKKEVTVLFHGWTSAPHTVTRWAYELSNKNKENVYCPLLPGHMKTDANQFINVTFEDWMTYTVSVIKTLIDAGFTIKSVGGLSMGSLLALNVSKIFDIKKVILIAPAFKAKDWLINLTPIIRRFVKKLPKKYEVKSMSDYSTEACKFKSDEYNKLTKDIYGAYTWFDPAYDLLMFQDYMNMIVYDSIKDKNILIYHSKEDDVINERTIIKVRDRLVKSGNAVSLVTVKMGQHEIFNDKRSDVISTVLNIIKTF